MNANDGIGIFNAGKTVMSLIPNSANYKVAAIELGLRRCADDPTLMYAYGTTTGSELRAFDYVTNTWAGNAQTGITSMANKQYPYLLSQNSTTPVTHQSGYYLVDQIDGEAYVDPQSCGGSPTPCNVGPGFAPIPEPEPTVAYANQYVTLTHVAIEEGQPVEIRNRKGEVVKRTAAEQTASGVQIPTAGLPTGNYALFTSNTIALFSIQ